MTTKKDEIEGLIGSVKQASRAANTRKAYKKGWSYFLSWCDRFGFDLDEIKPGHVVRFLVTMATRDQNRLSLNTIILSRSAINYYWTELNLPGQSPARDQEVTEMMSGLSRILDNRPRRVKALRSEHLVQILNLIDQGGRLYDYRNAAILSLGFSAALRRSELVQLKFKDIVRKQAGISVVIRKSKTDQAGIGQSVAVINGKRIKPIERLDRWLDKSQINSGYLFQTFHCGLKLTGRPLDNGEIAKLVKKYVDRIGLDPTEYSAHSLRAGFVTSAAAANARLDKIMEVTRHKSTTTLLKYIRDENVFDDHAGDGFM